MINFLIRFAALILCILAIAVGAYLTFTRTNFSVITQEIEEATSGPWLPEEFAGLFEQFQTTPEVE